MNFKLITLAILLPTLLCAQPKAVQDVNDPEAEKILQKLQTKYKNLSVSFDFTVKIEAPNAKMSSFTGNYTGQGTRYKLESQDGISVFNGTTLWSINPKDKEITQSEVKKSNKKIESPMDIISNYQTLYKYRVKEIPNATTIILELVPKNKYQSYFKIDLTINKAAQTIIAAKLYEKNGTRTYYTLSNVKENLKLSSTFFDVNKASYPGYEWMDL